VRVRDGHVSFTRGFIGTDGRGGVSTTRVCQPVYYVDGARVLGGRGAETGMTEDLGSTLATGPEVALVGLRPGDVEAVEVYRSAGTLPRELAAATDGCGVIVIWTRRK
jgi:hypothetical protein